MNIVFSYKDGSMTIPINPEELEINTPNNIKIERIVGLGEVAIPGSPDLSRVVVESVFWESQDTYTSKTRIEFFAKMAASKQAIQFTVEEKNIDMLVTIENFRKTVKAGEEDDWYYLLELVEYRPYGAKFIELKPVAGQSSTQPSTTTAASKDNLKIGMKVYFKGGSHWYSSDAKNPTGGKRTAGRATVTNLNWKSWGIHPVHLIGTNWKGHGSEPAGSNVWGWVNLDQVQLLEAVPLNTSTPPAQPRADNKAAVGATYTVKSGDTLWGISKALSGDGNNWRQLYDLNKSVIGGNPDLIYPGQVYTVPTNWRT